MLAERMAHQRRNEAKGLSDFTLIVTVGTKLSWVCLPLLSMLALFSSLFDSQIAAHQTDLLGRLACLR